MDSKVMDWKVVVALGGTFVVSVLVLRMDSRDVKAAFDHLVDAAKECVVALADNR